jgi:alkylation response protein AidB-like acyl-CoA dehydrogenase
VAGKDATVEFYGMHRAEVLTNKRYAKLKIGLLADPPAALEIVPTPYAEATGFWRKASPYYKDTHHKFRAAIREFIDREITPNAVQWDEKGTRPSKELNLKMGKEGIICALFGSAVPLMREMGWNTYIGGVIPEEFDEFHELILAEEMKRFGCYGLSDGLMGGNAIGLPVIFKFGTPDLIQRIAMPVIRGEKRICLCVSEPYAGSDVSRLMTHAKLNAEGTHWVVNGVKKWITGGFFSDYFTILAQTVDANGKPGMTMLVAERDDTINIKPIKTSYSAAAGTSYIEFVDTKVPVANVVGKAHIGFMYAMANFNKERWGMVAAGNQLSRNMIKECFSWAIQRKIFGKRLIDQPVIRFKLAEMVAEVEAVHSFLEDMTYQMQQLDDKTAMALGGQIALLKYKQTRAAQLVMDNAVQIFGGRALTSSGMGVLVEKFQRSYKMQAILGGSEEILADFAIRQALKIKKNQTHAKL